MKNFMRMANILTIALIGGYFTCKKKRANKPQTDQDDQLYAILTQTSSPQTGELKNGIMVGTKENLNKFESTDKNGVIVKLAGLYISR